MLEKSRRFVKAENQIHYLNCLAARAFYNVVYNGAYYYVLGARVVDRRDVAAVCAAYVQSVGIRAAGENFYERLARVGAIPYRVNIFDALADRRKRNSRRYSACHRREMRIELHYNGFFRRNRKLLLNFRQMAVLRQSIGLRALVSFAVGVRQIRFLSGPGNTAVRIYHDVLFYRPRLRA